MNGLRPVSTRVCKRIRCLPACPLGTRGTILSRRLAQERVRWYCLPRDVNPTATTDMKSAGPAIRYINHPVLAEDETIRPNPPGAAPLNARVTGLTPLSIERREAPIRRLLRAINRRQDVAISRYYSFLTAVNMAPKLSAGDYSSVLLSLRRRYISLRARHYLNENNDARLMSKNYIYEQFRQRLQAITANMQRSGYPLGILEYTHLLDCAAAIEDKDMAQRLWNQMTAEEGIRPDTWAYNCYMAAMCGAASTEREFRVTERTLSLRASGSDNPRDIALTIYKRMLERGLTPNAMTFDILMLAVARMGDLASVRRTLKEVWGVDVTTLGTPETPETMRPLMGPNSPLYPSIHTLTAVAVAFGSNGDIETAIRIVDHLSRRYDIRIPMAAWAALLNWTYVLTRDPAALPKYSVINLWRIMTAKPYNVKPTMEMYDYLIRSFIRRKMIFDAQIMINRGLRIFARIVHRISITSRALDAALGGFPGKKASYDVLHNLRRDLAFARSSEFRGRSMIRRWIELLCLGKGMRPYHARICVPNIVRKMRYFLASELHYVTQSGYVELMLGNKSRWAAVSIRRRKRPWTPLGTGAKEMDYLD